MAKLTDRTALSEAPNDADLVHIVDVSDATDDATGTSKKITITNLIKTYVEALTSYFNVSSDTLDDITAGSTNKHFTATDETKLDGIEASADVTDETNVTDALDGATLTDLGTPASGDKVLLQDASDSSNLKVALFSEFGGGGSGDATSIQGTAVDATVGSPSDGDILVYRSAGSDFVLEAKPAGGSNPALADITDVTITSVADNDILAYDTTSGDYINQSAAEAGLAASSHTHTESDISDLGTYQDVLSEGAFVDGDKTKLDGIEASADVTDTANVTAAGALMDSELTDIAAVKTLTDASIADTDTGSSPTAFVTPDGLQGSLRNLRFVDFIVVDAATDCATGTDLIEWEVPFACTIVQDDSNKQYFSAWNATAGTTGTMVVDIHKAGTTIMTTNKLDIETGETSTRTAATQPDLTTTTLAAGDLITIDVDAVHTTAAKGLTVRMALRPD